MIQIIKEDNLQSSIQEIDQVTKKLIKNAEDKTFSPELRLRVPHWPTQLSAAADGTGHQGTVLRNPCESPAKTGN